MTTSHRSRSLVALGSIVSIAMTSVAVGAKQTRALDILPPPVAGFHDGVYVPIDDLLLGEQGDASVVANGDLALTWAGSTFAGTVDEDDQLDSFDSGVGLRGAVTLELAAETGGDVTGLLELATVPLAEFEVGPIVVTPYLGVNVRFSGHAEAGAQVSVVAPFDTGAAFSFDGAADATSAARPSFRPQIGLPDFANALAFDAIVEVELTMTFMVTIEGIPVGGPVLIASLGAELHVDLLDDPWWRVDALTGLKYGWSMPDVTGAPEPLESPHPLFPERRRTIARARDAGPFADVATRWSRAFDIFNDDDAGAILPVGNEIVVAENENSPWLTTLDGAGNPTFQQTDSQSSGSQTVARTDAGGLLVAGVRGSGDLRVGSYAADGTPEWSKDVVVTDSTSGDWTDITSTADGAIIAGNVRRGTSAVERPALFALDDAGDLQWATEIDPGPGSDDATIVEVVQTPSGDLLAVGDISYELPDRSIDQWNVLVMRLDPDGTPLASYVVGGPYSDRVTGVAVQPDGSYAISGQTTATPGTNSSWVASFDPDGNLLWSATYADRVDAGYATATGITAVTGGDYVVSGTTGMVAKDGWMIRIDGSGMPIWSKSYVGEGEDELVGVVSLPVGVAAVGQTRTTNLAGTSFDDLWLVRTNIDGMLHFDPGSGFDTVNGAVQWNPTAIHVQLQLAPAIVATTVTVTDAPIAVTAANAANSLLTD